MTSFPKAKIHRFNEEISCAPPPGTYDPKVEAKIKGAPIPKEKRFPNQQFISSSLDNLDCASTQSSAIFRTPQVMRKLKLTPHLTRKFDTPGSSSSHGSTTNDILHKTPGSTKRPISSGEYHRLEQEMCKLAEKHLVEITGLHDQIFKLQESVIEVEKREAEIKLVLEEKSALAFEKHNDLLAVKHNLDTMEKMIHKEREDHKKYIKELQEEIVSLESKKEDLESVIAEKQTAIIRINDTYLNIENELKYLRLENEKYKQNIEIIDKKHSELISTHLIQSEEKIEQLGEALERKVGELKKRFDLAQEEDAEFQTKINYLISHDFELKARETETQLQSSFSKINEIQDLVKQNEKVSLERIKELDESCRLIYRELCKVEGQRNDLIVADLEKTLTVVKTQEKCNGLESDLRLCNEKCKKYELTLKTMQTTINALGDRLQESENEVIRLNSVEVDLEHQKIDLEEKTKLLISDIAALRCSMEKMEREIILDVTKLRDHLVAQVEYFKLKAIKIEGTLKDEIQGKQCRIDRLQNELYKADGFIEELKCENKHKSTEISELKSKLDEYKTSLNTIEREFNILKNVNLEQLGIIESLKKQLQSNCEKDKELNERNCKIESLKMSLNNLQERVTLTDEYKEKLEMQLLDAENNVSELKLLNESLINSKEELNKKLNVLQKSYDSAKEQLKTEVPNLQKDNINKAARILELSVNIDTLNEVISHSEVKIDCLRAEKHSFSMQLEESREQISVLETAIADKDKIINSLSDELNIEKAKYKDYVAETETIFDTFKKHSELMSINADNGSKLLVAEEKIQNLEEELRTAHNQNNKRDTTESEVKQLREDLEVTRLELRLVTDERNKLDNELAELIGHQNKHQKIRHIHQLKQAIVESREKCDKLEIENIMLKKKIAEFKENSNKANLENTPKAPKSKVKITASPAVLRDRNC